LIFLSDSARLAKCINDGSIARVRSKSDAVDLLVTDEAPAPALAQVFAAAGLDVEVATQPGASNA
jgi:hypothetical protein